MSQSPVRESPGVCTHSLRLSKPNLSEVQAITSSQLEQRFFDLQAALRAKYTSHTQPLAIYKPKPTAHSRRHVLGARLDRPKIEDPGHAPSPVGSSSPPQEIRDLATVCEHASVFMIVNFAYYQSSISNAEKREGIQRFARFPVTMRTFLFWPGPHPDISELSPAHGLPFEVTVCISQTVSPLQLLWLTRKNRPTYGP